MTGRARRQQRKRMRTAFFGVRVCIRGMGPMYRKWERVPAEFRGRDFGFHGQPVPARVAARVKP